MRTGLDSWRIKTADFSANSSEAEKLQFLVNYAVLAPSKYNGQPWLFEICGDSLDVICDRSWAFREADPRGRELTLSCGAALFNLSVAARRFGHALRIQPFPWPGDRYLLARVHLEKLPPEEERNGLLASAGAGSSPRRSLARQSNSNPSDEELFDAMMKRCTYRRSFWNGAPPDEVLAACADAAASQGAWLHFIKEEKTRGAAAELVAQGYREQMAHKSFRRELAKWVHPARGKSKDGVSGSLYRLPGPLAPCLSLLLWTINCGGLIGARNRDLAKRAPVLAVLGTAEDSPQAWLAAGQALESLLLRATVAGLSASFFSQPVEVEHLRSELLGLTGRKGFPQMLLRLGYGEAARHTPRRPAKEVVI
jgi:hypothetical protein